MALTPRPTAEQVKVLREQEEIGLYEARARLHDAWTKENVSRIKAGAAMVQTHLIDASTVDRGLASLLLDLCALIEAAMDEDSIT